MSIKSEQYVRQSVVVEAMQLPYEEPWDEDSIEDFTGSGFMAFCDAPFEGRVVILYSEDGLMSAQAGDWLVNDPDVGMTTVVPSHQFNERFSPAHEALQGLSVDDFQSHAKALQDRIDILENQNSELQDTVGGLVDSIFNLVDGPFIRERLSDNQKSLVDSGTTTRIPLEDRSGDSSGGCGSHCVCSD